jgi:hypothetical protein
MAESVMEKYKVPTGLRPLLEALARETLRAQPNDLYQFGQIFFDVLQQHRLQNPSVDVISDPLSYDMFRTELHHKYKTQQASVNSRPGSPADLAATKIQAAFRGHVVRKHPEKFGIDAVPFDRRRSHDRLNSMDNKKDLKRHSVGGYSLETTMTSPEDRAATKIQAEIRGFLTRKKMGNIKKENNDAATKIQAHIRGYLTRKHLEEEGLLSPSRSRNSLLSNRSDENLDQTATAAVN